MFLVVLYGFELPLDQFLCLLLVVAPGLYVLFSNVFKMFFLYI